MTTIQRVATLRVVNTNVDLGGGISLPIGVYDGTITEMVINIRGREMKQVARVAIYLTEEFLQGLGFPFNPNSSREGIEGDFTASFLKKDIVEI